VERKRHVEMMAERAIKNTVTGILGSNLNQDTSERALQQNWFRLVEIVVYCGLRLILPLLFTII